MTLVMMIPVNRTYNTIGMNLWTIVNLLNHRAVHNMIATCRLLTMHYTPYGLNTPV